MNRTEFWKIIDDAVTQTPKAREVCELIKHELRKRSEEEIVAFEEESCRIMHEAYRADLWTIAYIILGGCSDDGFDYLRYWLICQGSSVFQQVLDHPETLADFDQRTAEYSCQEFGSIAREVYEEKTDDYQISIDESLYGPGELIGEILDDDAKRERYPELWARFMED